MQFLDWWSEVGFLTPPFSFSGFWDLFLSLLLYLTVTNGIVWVWLGVLIGNCIQWLLFRLFDTLTLHHLNFLGLHLLAFSDKANVVSALNSCGLRGWFLSTTLEANPAAVFRTVGLLGVNVWASERFVCIPGWDRVTNEATCSGKLVVSLEFAAVYILFCNFVLFFEFEKANKKFYYKIPFQSFVNSN